MHDWPWGGEGLWVCCVQVCVYESVCGVEFVMWSDGESQ